MANKVWIGSIPHCVSEEELHRVVSKYGMVAEYFYKPDLIGNRGWCFATYSTLEEALDAIAGLDGMHVFEGSDKAVEARIASREGSGDKPPHTGQQSYSTHSNTFAPKHTAPPPAAMAGIHTYLWEQYMTPDNLPYYYNTITGHTQWQLPIPPKEMQTNGTSPVAVAAKSKNFGPPGSNLFIFHLPSDWNDSDLSQHFNLFGNVVSCRIQKDVNGRNSGFGFVSFDNPYSAKGAISRMNCYNVSGKVLKVELKKGEEQYVASNES